MPEKVQEPKIRKNGKESILFGGHSLWCIFYIARIKVLVSTFCLFPKEIPSSRVQQYLKGRLKPALFIRDLQLMYIDRNLDKRLLRAKYFFLHNLSFIKREETNIFNFFSYA